MGNVTVALAVANVQVIEIGVPQHFVSDFFAATRAMPRGFRICGSQADASLGRSSTNCKSLAKSSTGVEERKRC